jgi:hypothetical protein
LVPGEPTLRPVSDLAGKRLKLLRPLVGSALINALMNKKSNDGGGLTRVVNAVARAI